MEWTDGLPMLVNEPSATATTSTAFTEHFGEQRVIALPALTGSEDVGVFGDACGAPTVYWFWGGLDADTVTAALRDGRFDSLPANHSPLFAPVLEPTLTTGIQTLVVAALTWLGDAVVGPE